MGGVATRTSPTERFIAKIRVDNKSGCWLWLGKLRAGYALFKVDGKGVAAHIWAYERFVGPIPPKKLCCHKCDVPACVNPYHIFLGSNKDNTVDAMLKNRMKPRGLYAIALSDIPKIRSSYRSGATKHELASKFGIKWCTVHKIVTNKTYRFV